MVQLIGFGDSSLNFTVYFYCMNMFNIEFIKSDIRFKIDKHFGDNGIIIPFPQRDIPIKIII